MAEFDALEFAEMETPSVQALQIERECGSDPTAIGEAVNAAFDQLGTSLRQMQLNPTGPPRIIYTSYNQDKVCFTIAIPINTLPAGTAEGGTVSAGLMSGGKYMRFTHRGSYSNLAETYGQIAEYLRNEGLMESEADWAHYMPMWEEYINDPDETPEQDLLTYIYLPKV
jgi:effector-binding domain-containing protein